VRSEEHGKTVAWSSAVDDAALAIGNRRLLGAFYSTIKSRQSKSAELSLGVKCGINGLKQSRVAEWLDQALDRTLF
jgi:hypothetical protein